jgi:hypothetical protein
VTAPLPDDEPARLAALHDARVLDTAPEEDFDDIALLASEICGTPMGLVAIVCSIVDAHHGSIRVDSEPGIGTTVRVTLPKP